MSDVKRQKLSHPRPSAYALVKDDVAGAWSSLHATLDATRYSRDGTSWLLPHPNGLLLLGITPRHEVWQTVARACSADDSLACPLPAFSVAYPPPSSAAAAKAKRRGKAKKALIRLAESGTVCTVTLGGATLPISTPIACVFIEANSRLVQNPSLLVTHVCSPLLSMRWMDDERWMLGDGLT